MSWRYFSILVVLSSVGLADAAIAAPAHTNKAAQATKSKATTAKTRTAAAKRKIARHIAHRLVPPPPAYMPSILPELYYQRNVAQDEDYGDEDVVAEKPKNPYAKYFYSRDNEVPKAVQARSGVTNWAAPR